MRKFVLIPAVFALVVTASGVASAQLLSKTTPTPTQGVATPSDRSVQLKVLINETFTLSPWTFKEPPPFELPDSRDQPRSLARDYRGKVVVAFLFAQY